MAGGDAAKFEELAALPQRFPAGRGSVPNPQPANLRPGPGDPPGAQAFNSADTEHFLNEHTYNFYDFGETGTKQSFWPVGTTEAEVVAALEEAISGLRAQGATVISGKPVGVVITSVPGVHGAQFGVRAGGTEIGQFFPVAGSGVTLLPKAVLDAIAKIVLP